MNFKVKNKDGKLVAKTKGNKLFGKAKPDEAKTLPPFMQKKGQQDQKK